MKRTKRRSTDLQIEEVGSDAEDSLRDVETEKVLMLGEFRVGEGVRLASFSILGHVVNIPSAQKTFRFSA